MTKIWPLQLAKQVHDDLEGSMSDLAGGDELLADEYWEDPDMLGDLLGDRVHDHLVPFGLRGEKLTEARKEVLKALAGYGHEAMAKACNNLIERIR